MYHIAGYFLRGYISLSEGVYFTDCYEIEIDFRGNYFVNCVTYKATPTQV
jgi:hypothetical protein